MVFQAQKLRIIYLLKSIFLLLINPCATQIFFNYTDFSQTINNKPIIRTGNATISGSVIQLTPDEVDNWGRATYSEQMHLWDEKSGKVANFTSNFSFTIDSQGKDSYSDGIMFFLSTPNYPVPSPTDGSGLGLLSRNQMQQPTFLAENKFVAVEFDTFQNDEFDPLNSVREHVGININSMKSQISTPWYCTIKENRTYSASINYDSSTQNLSVTFTGFKNTTIQQHLSFVINLTDHLPESVEFGFSASTGLISELHILSTWSFKSTSPSTIQQSPAPPVDKNKDEPKTKLVVGLSLGASILIIGLVLVCFLYRKKCREGKGEKEEKLGFDLSMDDEFERGIGPKKFSYNELVSATSNFAEENKLGQGGFGRVYKGYLRVINSYVAIKRVSEGSAQGIKEYISEVRIIGRLRHRNLVQLIGWCHEKDDLLLIYEFMSNGSLDLHLFKGKSLLTWVERYNIARGLASALQYLHEEWEQCVLHRDIKSSNILLDSNLNAKLGDFGLARLVDHVKGSQTTALAGTWGYLAPECIMSGRASKETDVYSFGIVVLEIACGRKPAEPDAKQDEIIMLEWLWELYGARNLLKAADPRLGGDFDEPQMERLMVVGLWCAHPDYNARPSIRKAIHVLDFEVTLPILEPKLPLTTFLTLPSFASTSATSKSENHGT
ncbi:L-type lectin-domain containing receptor kinase IX.1-like [Quercus robur]|uniref:L-type lectin-domain containing receptor kinase IX.1-like n=1 Tax=Quercus robur TaxID=38942 RepID=UPI00216269B4|nr:L-type lectin-domain containing receptor kinase IX.1-like [Quercus robur]